MNTNIHASAFALLLPAIALGACNKNSSPVSSPSDDEPMELVASGAVASKGRACSFIGKWTLQPKLENHLSDVVFSKSEANADQMCVRSEAGRYPFAACAFEKDGVISTPLGPCSVGDLSEHGPDACPGPSAPADRRIMGFECELSDCDSLLCKTTGDTMDGVDVGEPFSLVRI